MSALVISYTFAIGLKLWNVSAPMLILARGFQTVMWGNVNSLESHSDMTHVQTIVVLWVHGIEGQTINIKWKSTGSKILGADTYSDQTLASACCMRYATANTFPAFPCSISVANFYLRVSNNVMWIVSGVLFSEDKPWLFLWFVFQRFFCTGNYKSSLCVLTITASLNS